MYRIAAEELTVGVIASGKLGNAVERNRIKRRIKEAIRKIDQETPIYATVVLIPKKETIEMRYSDIISAIKRMVEQ